MKIWHPFTQEQTAPSPIKIADGSGEFIFDNSGKRYIDMVSSWWVNTLGHANKEIADAISEQAKKLEHVIFAGFTHAPAENLCQELSKVLPNDLNNFFFSDNGSTAVEVAIKMAYQYFLNLGSKERSLYINLEGGYHGDTFGAMSAAGQNSKYHSTFSSFFFDTYSIDFPGFNEELENIAFEKLKRFLKYNGERVCALIIEPLVQGAAGMRMYRPGFLDRIVKEVRKYEILVIFDEVMTGFYRTGTMFAMNQCQTVPDIICLSKGLTAGFMPLSLTITVSKVFNAFLSKDWKKAFIHGHSYTANPIACMAACTSLDILQRTTTRKNIQNIIQIHHEYLKLLSNISEQRQIGTIAAFNIESATKAQYMAKQLLDRGIIVRPLGETIYLMPPYCIAEENLVWVYQEIKKVLENSNNYSD